jgi:hypothetical protein
MIRIAKDDWINKNTICGVTVDKKGYVFICLKTETIGPIEDPYLGTICGCLEIDYDEIKKISGERSSLET